MGQDALSILLEVERGENYIRREYEIALNLDWGVAIHGVLSNHYVKVKWAYDRVVRLRDSYAK